MAGLGAQLARGERGFDIGLEPAVERMGLAGGGHLTAQQHGGAARLFQREGGGHPHTPGNARDRIAHPGIGAGDLRLDLQPHLGSDGPGKGIFVGEVIEEATLGHRGAGDDLVDRDGINRTVDQQFEPGGDQRGTGALHPGGEGGLAGHDACILD